MKERKDHQFESMKIDRKGSMTSVANEKHVLRLRPYLSVLFLFIALYSFALFVFAKQLWNWTESGGQILFVFGAFGLFFLGFGIFVFSLLVRHQTQINVLQLENSSLRNKFIQAVEELPLLIWISGSDHKVEYFNKKWSEFTGIPADRFDEEAARECIHPEDLPRVLELWKQKCSFKEPFETEYRLKSHDGSYRTQLSRAVPLKNTEGEVVKWFGCVTDIEDEKHIQNELQEAKDRLSETLQRQEEFLAISTHELRAPLTSLSLQSSVLAQSLEKTENFTVPVSNVRKYLDISQRHFTALARLIDNLFDLSAMTAGVLRLLKKQFNLSELMHEIVDRFCTMDTAVACDMQIEKGIFALGDKLRFEQVVTNLLSNALKYGKGNPIKVGLRQDGDVAELTFVDKGIGISVEKQKTIFEKFERLSSDNNGLGLGLYITRQIITAHGGTIEVKSTPGEGSTFIVRWPLHSESHGFLRLVG